MGLTGVKKGVPSILSHRDSLVSYRRYAPLDDKTNKTGDPVLGSIWDTRHFNREAKGRQPLELNPSVSLSCLYQRTH